MKVTALGLFILLQTSFAAADFRDAKEALKAKNYTIAAEQFVVLSGLGHAAASFELAKLYERGLGREMNVSEALSLYTLAADQGHLRAGKKVKSLAKALSEEAVTEASERTSKLLERSGKKALASTLLPEDGGRPVFMTESTKSSLFGWPKEEHGRYQATIVDLEFDVSAAGYPRDVRLAQEAREPYVREVMKDFRTRRFQNIAGAFSVRKGYLFTRFDPREQYGPGRLLRKMKRRAQTGSPYRKYNYARAQELAEYYGYQFSSRDSNNWYLQAATGGYPKAQYLIGYRAFFGITLAQDMTKGLRWMKAAADAGDARANYFLARVVMQRDGVEATTDLLRTAAEAGHTTAMLWLARILAHSDLERAQHWLQAAQGHMDQVSWHQVAAEVYAPEDAARAKALLDQARVHAERLGAPLEALDLLAWGSGRS